MTELKDRLNIVGLSFIFSLVFCFFYSKEIIKIIQLIGLKKNLSFLQISPGDFFFTSIDVFLFIFKIGLYFGILCSVPSVLYQTTSYIIPGLTIREKNFFILTTLSSIILFLLGFFYYILELLFLLMF